MTSEQEAAAERLRDHLSGGDPYPFDGGAMQMCDTETLAQAYLAEHPAGDGLAIDEAWLHSVGGVWDEKMTAFRFNYHRLYLWFRMSGQHWLTFESTYGGNVGTYQRPKTRGEFRRLCAAIGITLRTN